MRYLVAILAALLLSAGAAGEGRAARLKDIASIGGTRANPVIGYGLVVGLNGTGDTDTTTFTMQSIMSMLQKFGVSVPLAKIKVKNVAAVMVTGDLPTFAKKGWRMDVVISSMGDASSLEGGTLLMTPLLAGNGEAFAVAQGPVLVGGFQASGQTGSAVQKNHPTVGRIPGGAVIEREIAFVPSGDMVQVLLWQPDFATAARTAAAINRKVGSDLAEARDGSEIRVRLPENAKARVVEFLAEIGEAEVTPDSAARVVVNEKTGTVVIGRNVKINTVALAHGSLNIVIRERPEVSQPAPFSKGTTVVTPTTEVKAKEEKRKVALMDTGATIADLVDALNKLGITPRDLIAILQALKEAGALQADLSVM
ncbi:MAG: flagellar basal body P-ring protein FlgI [Deltaproteobacteria bacterium]|nr:flagellar basal body P-ring protein FlgI [Deltaproteobacteria bacterium]